MKKQTKEKWCRLELLVRYRIRKMQHPGRVFAVSCVSILVAGFLGGVALGRHVEGRKAEETMQKETDRYESLQKEYDVVKEQTEAQDKDTRPWYLMLVNQSHPMEEGYVPELANIDASHQVDKRVLEPLQQMLKAASEHATGLAMDIVSTEYAGLDEKQGETDDQKWLMEHCYEYGFILRYPQDKSDDTGIIYEPWHYRYVGTEAALAIRDQGVTLEEYLNEEY